ncbi:MAG: ferritin-like domain-containing protein [Myxococcota bacterium]
MGGRGIELAAVFVLLLGACGDTAPGSGSDEWRPPSGSGAGQCNGGSEVTLASAPAEAARGPLDCRMLCLDAEPDSDFGALLEECSVVEDRHGGLATGGFEGGSSTGDATTTAASSTTGEGSTTEAGSTTGDTSDDTVGMTSGGFEGGGTSSDGERVPIQCDWSIPPPGWCIGGRASAAWGQRDETIADDACARWLAEAAHDEAGSVASFRLLAAELAVHDAPGALLRALGRAAEDERRHAAAVSSLARARGAEPIRPRLRPVPSRTLEAIALENAVEGCVRETFNALLAAHQARHAESVSIREVMCGIAEDECRHAELAWALDAWFRTRLDAEACARLDGARRLAWEAMHADPVPRIDADARTELGLPSRETARELAAGLRRAMRRA